MSSLHSGNQSQSPNPVTIVPPTSPGIASTIPTSVESYPESNESAGIQSDDSSPNIES